MNTDTKLTNMALSHRETLGDMTRARKNWRVLLRGRAMKLIERTYPLNKETVTREWRRMAGL